MAGRDEVTEFKTRDARTHGMERYLALCLWVLESYNIQVKNSDSFYQLVQYLVLQKLTTTLSTHLGNRC